MSVFVISDLHLSVENASKSMDVFGKRWLNYTEKLKKQWQAVVTPADTVIIPGDISWGLTLADALPDLTFLHALHGNKILSKGNHDFWWSTVSKLEACFTEHELSSIQILNNNALEIESFNIAGTRGWFTEPSLQSAVNTPDFDKIVNRENIRLRLSLTQAKALQAQNGKEIIAFFHFPLIWGDVTVRSTIDILHEFGIKRCFFGHIHGTYGIPQTTEFEGISFSLIAADYLNFTPFLIS